MDPDLQPEEKWIVVEIDTFWNVNYVTPVVM